MFSAACAGVAGALYAHFNQYASPETFSFSTSVLLVVMVALGGWGHYWGPVLGAAVFTAVPELLHEFQDAELLVFGIGMVARAAVSSGRPGRPPQRWRKLLLATKRGTQRRAARSRPMSTMSAMSLMNALEVSGVSVVFGGLRAVDDLSFRVAEGSIKGSHRSERRGQDHAVQCHLRHHAAAAAARSCSAQRDVTALRRTRAPRSAWRAPSRTCRYSASMSVIENVMVGRHTRLRAGWSRGLLGLGHAREERATEALALEKLALLGLADRAGDPAGEPRLCRSQAAGDRARARRRTALLLLDEPMAGVPLAEQNRIVEVIRQVNASGVTIVLVEHNMRVVMSVCADILVMDHGRRLAEGDPAFVARHPDVVRAYLGGEFEPCLR